MDDLQINIMTEQWKDIKGYEYLYEISNLGRCKRLARDKYALEELIIKPELRPNGNLSYKLTGKKKPKNITIGKLVYLHFVDDSLDYSDTLSIKYLDGNSLNNRADNLVKTDSYNYIKKGYRDLNEMIDEDTKYEILRLFYETHNNIDSEIAKQVGLDRVTVSWFLSKHLEYKKNKINNRKYSDIDWGEL